MTIEKIFIGVNNERIELTGADKEAFIAQRELDIQQENKRISEAKAKAAEKAALLDRLGITADEARLLLS